ncbi:efflux RND transporter periplasmic adaptor subunit [Burkholderia sp. MR1-5-21]
MIFTSHSRSNDQVTANNGPLVVTDGDKIKVPEHSPLRSHLEVQAVTPTSLDHSIVVAGQVDANPTLTVNILPPLTGHVTDIMVQLGERVSKGQTLATIASGDMAQARSDVEKARDALDLAVKTRDRTHGVGGVGGAAVKDIEAADSGVTQAQAELTRAQTRLSSFAAQTGGKIDGHMLTLVAPRDGVVTALNVGKGGYVDDPNATMMTITDISKVYVTAWVPEDQIDNIKTGQEADISLSAYPGELLRSHVQSVSNVMAPDTRRLPVRMVFDNPNDHLIPNMYADVSFKVPQPAQVIVPQSALLMNNDSTSVFVEVAPWTFVRRKVELGYDEGSQVRVLSGLAAGDHVIVKGGVLIND